MAEVKQSKTHYYNTDPKVMKYVLIRFVEKVLKEQGILKMKPKKREAGGTGNLQK
jgi:hypothetical protein